MFWNKKNNNVKVTNETLGNFVKYSYHTVKVNPGMIINEFERKICEKRKELGEKEAARKRNSVIQINCSVTKECAICESNREELSNALAYGSGNIHNSYLFFEYPETIQIINIENKKKELYYSIPVSIIQKTLKQDEEYKKEIEIIEKELKLIVEELNEFKKKYMYFK